MANSRSSATDFFVKHVLCCRRTDQEEFFELEGPRSHSHPLGNTIFGKSIVFATGCGQHKMAETVSLQRPPSTSVGNRWTRVVYQDVKRKSTHEQMSRVRQLKLQGHTYGSMSQRSVPLGVHDSVDPHDGCGITSYMQTSTRRVSIVICCSQS